MSHPRCEPFQGFQEGSRSSASSPDENLSPGRTTDTASAAETRRRRQSNDASLSIPVRRVPGFPRRLTGSPIPRSTGPGWLIGAI